MKSIFNQNQGLGLKKKTTKTDGGKSDFGKSQSTAVAKKLYSKQKEAEEDEEALKKGADLLQNLKIAMHQEVKKAHLAHTSSSDSLMIPEAGGNRRMSSAGKGGLGSLLGSNQKRKSHIDPRHSHSGSVDLGGPASGTDIGSGLQANDDTTSILRELLSEVKNLREENLQLRGQVQKNTEKIDQMHSQSSQRS